MVEMAGIVIFPSRESTVPALTIKSFPLNSTSTGESDRLMYIETLPRRTASKVSLLIP